MDINSNQLSKREKDVVTLLLLGKSNKQVALELGISNRTVEYHSIECWHRLESLNCQSRISAHLH